MTFGLPVLILAMMALSIVAGEAGKGDPATRRLRRPERRAGGRQGQPRVPLLPHGRRGARPPSRRGDIRGYYVHPTRLSATGKAQLFYWQRQPTPGCRRVSTPSSGPTWSPALDPAVADPGPRRPDRLRGALRRRQPGDERPGPRQPHPPLRSRPLLLVRAHERLGLPAAGRVRREGEPHHRDHDHLGLARAVHRRQGRRTGGRGAHPGGAVGRWWCWEGSPWPPSSSTRSPPSRSPGA